jgi:hypothetical protein
MPVSFEVTANTAEVAAALDADLRSIWPRVTRAIKQATASVLRLVADQKITAAGILEPRTGNLRRSLYQKIEQSSDTITGRVGFDMAIAPYARIQELGGVVTAKRAANLTIPIGEALTAKGVARFSARQLISNPFAFGYKGTFVAKGILFGSVEGGGILPLFVLKPSVVLPARLPLLSALNDQRDSILASLEATVAEATQVAGGSLGAAVTGDGAA